MDNLPTAPEVSSQTVAPIVPTPVTSVLPATSVAPSSPPSSSKKMIMIIVGALVVLGLAYLGYTSMMGSTVTQEPAKITSEAPPSLKMATTGLKGSFTETDPTYGFMAFNADDVKNFKIPTNTGYADLEAGVNYVYTLRPMTWKEAASQYIDPAADKAFMAFFDPSIGKFKVYPRGPFADTVTMTEPAFSTETIPAGRGGIIISRGKSKAYNFANGKTKALATGVTAVDPKLEGWVLLPATSTKIKDFVSTLNGMDQVIYVQKSQTEFEKVSNKDTQELKDYFLLWVYLQKPSGVNDGGGVKPPVFNVTGFTPGTITLNAPTDLTTVQSLSATLTGDNLDTISVITSNDLSITTNTIVATAKSVTYNIAVKPAATAGDKVFVAKSKDGTTLGSFKITAALPAAPSDTTPKNIVFLPKTLTLQSGVPQLQQIAGTLTGENLDTVGTITSDDPNITAIVEKAESKLVTFQIYVGSKATKGNKAFTINGKDKKAITAFIIPASLAGEDAVAKPVITKVDPSFLTQGDVEKEITITGTDLLGAGITSVDVGMKLISQVAATTDTLKFTVSVDATAPVGKDKKITVTRIGNATPAVYSTFEIKASAIPVVDTVSPAFLYTGKSYDQVLILQGKNLTDAVVTFDDPGIVIDEKPTSDIAGKIAIDVKGQQTDATISLYVKVGPAATLGKKTITIKTNTGTVTKNILITSVGPKDPKNNALPKPMVLTNIGGAENGTNAIALNSADLKAKGLSFTTTDPNTDSALSDKTSGAYYMKYNFSLGQMVAGVAELKPVWSTIKNGLPSPQGMKDADCTHALGTEVDGMSWTCPSGVIPAAALANISAGKYILSGQVCDNIASCTSMMGGIFTVDAPKAAVVLPVPANLTTDAKAPGMAPNTLTWSAPVSPTAGETASYALKIVKKNIEDTAAFDVAAETDVKFSTSSKLTGTTLDISDKLPLNTIAASGDYTWGVRAYTSTLTSDWALGHFSFTPNGNILDIKPITITKGTPGVEVSLTGIYLTGATVAAPAATTGVTITAPVITEKSITFTVSAAANAPSASASAPVNIDITMATQGKTKFTVPVTVLAPVAAFTVTSISPAIVYVGDKGVVMTIKGTGFIEGKTKVTGTTSDVKVMSYSFVSDTEMSATVDAVTVDYWPAPVNEKLRVFPGTIGSPPVETPTFSLQKK